jgi:hypothetical protein
MKKQFKTEELVALLKDFWREYHRLPDKGEFSRFAKCEEWEIRKRGGMPGLRKAAGLNSPEAQLSVQMSKLKSENSRLSSMVSQLQKLAVGTEKLQELIGAIDPDDINVDASWMEGANRPKGTRGIGVLTLSDIHFDEVVRGEEIGHCNFYNRQIAERRLKNVFRNTVKLLKSHMAKPNYDGMVLNLGGDLLSGNIHDELVETNEFAINQSILALEEILIEGTLGLADEFGKVHVVCVTGNHGRMHKKPRAKNRAFDNFEWIIYQHMARFFKSDSRISFQIPEGADALYNVYRRNYMLTHGDQFSGGNGIGGIMVPIMRGMSKKLVKQQAIRQAFDLLIMGHWHQYIHMNEIVVNGSVKGYDEYAAQNNFSFEKPQQALWIEHPEHGVTFRMPVLCDKDE